MNKTTEIIATSILSVLTTLLASYLFYIYTDKNPRVSYEILPISSFTSEKNPLSILSITIENDGSKEAEEINGFIEFDSSTIVDEEKIGLNPISIKYSFIRNGLNKYNLECPLLNSGEKISLTFLCKRVLRIENINIQLRGRGIKIGDKIKLESDERNRSEFVILWGTMGMLLLSTGIIAFVIFNQRKVRKFYQTLDELNEKKFNILKDKLKSMKVDVNKLLYEKEKK